jgi:signal transduction histidine kinase
LSQREFLDAVKVCSDTLLLLVNDVLDISKIEAGEMKLEHIAFSLRDLLRGTMQSLWFRIAQKGLRFECRAEMGLPEIVMGDPTRLKQILTNLVANALKFTEQGGIVVRVRRGEGHNLHFSVQDTGIGIDEDGQSRLFKPFVQVCFLDYCRSLVNSFMLIVVRLSSSRPDRCSVPLGRGLHNAQIRRHGIGPRHLR